MWRPTDPHVLALIIRDQKQKFIKKTNSYFVTDRAFRTMKEDLKVPTFSTITYTYTYTHTHPIKMPSLLDMRALCKPTVRWEVLTYAELKNVAKCRGIKGYYKLNKSQLIHHLNA
jgi:hypothetical protein